MSIWRIHTNVTAATHREKVKVNMPLRLVAITAQIALTYLPTPASLTMEVH